MARGRRERRGQVAPARRDPIPGAGARPAGPERDRRGESGAVRHVPAEPLAPRPARRRERRGRRAPQGRRSRYRATARAAGSGRRRRPATIPGPSDRRRLRSLHAVPRSDPAGAGGLPPPRRKPARRADADTADRRAAVADHRVVSGQRASAARDRVPGHAAGAADAVPAGRGSRHRGFHARPRAGDRFCRRLLPGARDRGQCLLPRRSRPRTDQRARSPRGCVAGDAAGACLLRRHEGLRPPATRPAAGLGARRD